MPGADRLTVDFARLDPVRFASIVARGTPEEMLEVLAGLPPQSAIAVAASLPGSRFPVVLKLDDARLRPWLEAADPETGIAFLARLSRDSGIALAESLQNRALKRQLLRALRYPPHCVGALIAAETVQVSQDAPVTDLLEELRGAAERRDMPMVVVDAQRRYLGKLDVWRLLLTARAGRRASDYLLQVAALRPETSVADARMAPQWRSHHWLPVVDYDGRVIGSVSRDDLQEESAPTAEPIWEIIIRLGQAFIRVSSNLLQTVILRSQP
jgi:Mg/Co/Ni transporter MgtE